MDKLEEALKRLNKLRIDMATNANELDKITVDLQTEITERNRKELLKENQQ